MQIETLRAKHPTFTYENFSLTNVRNRLEVAFQFSLTPDITFHSKVSIPLLAEVKHETVANLVFHLGLVEAISYWKATCSPQLVVKAGQLSEQQTLWWHDLFIHGLGEFFYRNNIDFSDPEFFTITASHDAPTHSKMPAKQLSGDLVMVGGGKDSAVTLETLKDLRGRRNVLMLNPVRPALEIAKVAAYHEPLVVQRTLDSKLFELNRKGYLNGHTPFSAYLAFLGVFVGLLHDYEHLIASNEQSAGEGNTVFLGLEVNHQYSKSVRFEKLFRQYCAAYLQSDIQYFSFLRPLYELQIAQLFVPHLQTYRSFCSCNVNRGESWCNQCPKCAFVYLSLFPFITEKRRRELFGNQDYFATPAIQQHIIDLVGLGTHKPFDCVGTTEESVMAVALTIKKYESEQRPLPPFLLMLKDKLPIQDERIQQTIEHRLKTDWNNNHFLPPEYARLLKEKLSQI